jgi:beta-lactamase regulating signal transducer with metallopeptidase domain
MTIYLDDLAPLAWTQFWQVTLVAIVAGGMARFICQNRPRLAYALWMLVVAKALTPPIWSSPTGVFSWALAVRETPPAVAVESRPVPILVSAIPTAPIPTEVAPAIPPDAGISAEGVLTSVWGVGLVAFLILAIGKQMVCSILIRRSRQSGHETLIAILNELRRRLGIRRQVKLVVSSRPIGPAAFGLLRPTIVLPEILLADKTSEQIELILAHELVHIKRGDVIAGYLQLAAQVVWWFHPLIWWANREATRERERCCDRDVVEGVGCRPSAYARTLLSVVELKGRLRIPAAIPGVRAMEVTSQRLETIMRFQSGSGKGAWLPRIAFACGAILLVPGAGLTLSATDDQVPRPKAETKVEVDTKAAAEFKKAKDELIWAEKMYEKKYVKKAQLEEARWKVLKLKLIPNEFEALRGELDSAKADVTRAEDRVDWANQMEKKGYVSKAQRVREELDLQQARFKLQHAETKAMVLSKFDRRKLGGIEPGDAKGEVLRQALASVHAKEQKGVTLKGVARERGTGRPIEGATITARGKESTVITNKDGRFEFAGIPKAEEYALVGSPKPGEPFFITSARIKPEGETTVSLDLEFVRGIPFRVRVIDRNTGKPIKGGLSYFPTDRNPLKPGVVGYLGASDSTLGAFYEAIPDDRGDYHGAVLPGPGILKFNLPVDNRGFVEDRNPLFLYPDGDDGKTVLRDNDGKPIAAMVPASLGKDSKPNARISLALTPNDAVIVINPKENAKEVSYEIKIDQAEASK